MKDFFVRKHFSKVDKLIAAIGLLFLVWVFAVPTSRFLHPIGLSFLQGQMQFTRAVPFGQVYATWSIEMGVRSFECYARGVENLTPYGDNPDFPGQPWTARFATPADLEECFELLNVLDVSQPFIIEHTHQVWILGHFPLRPMHTKWICQNRGLDCDIAERGGGFVEWIFNT